ncbi:beta-galactosidase [Actinocrinis puniceicyclus]|uniref:Beta-galactosidase n=1 Tax=Actinocrinis puniceicyclus TaxID=977794 RepID=A0A8J7WJ15_9ACTN|nr:beta-galactosidase [Actinocrinis puniceicyclus]MBS2963211.1 beta-galactosidase [Actinocrinis puniceicyclus]
MADADGSRTVSHYGIERAAWPRLDALAYGGDYNPEQWPEEVWAEDVALMREAGVNLVSLGIFSWVKLEPEPGRFEFGWLDRIIGLLHEAGIHVDLATPTAAPPAWFRKAHPDIRPVTREGHVLGGGARQTYCPHAPEYRAACRRIAEQLAARYAGHPAVVLWHIHNEYGCHVSECYCPYSVAAFREWLQGKYGSLDALNAAWGTSFWGQTYTAWDEIDAPREAPTGVNPAQRLDFARFSSASILELFKAERDIVKAHNPAIPVTTNFMALLNKSMDLWSWAREVDLVSDDHYTTAGSPVRHIELAMAADLCRSLAGGAPWLLMEHSTSAVNWQERNVAKLPGEMMRNSLAHVARGADGVLFFQWRASRAGSEKYHSAMLPHAGTDSRIWREVVALGRRLEQLREVRGSRVRADTAIVWDWESWWALELDSRPSVDVRFVDAQFAYYEQLWRAHVTADFAHPSAGLSRYRLVVVPQSYILTSRWADNLRRYVEGGGTLVVSFFSGIVDENDAVHLGGYPGALRDLLGVRVDEFLPLAQGQAVALKPVDGGDAAGTGTLWAEPVELRGAESVLAYGDGPAAGHPAVTRHRFGRGHAWYVSTRPDPGTLREILRRAALDAGVEFDTQTPDTLETVRRVGADGAVYPFTLDHAQ